MKDKKWKMPKWMKKYEKFIRNAGGNSIEELVNDRTTVQINLPLAMISVAVSSQVILLTVLHDKGLLK